MFHSENSSAFAAAYLSGERPDAPEVSPVHANLAGLRPLLLHVGSTETLLDDSRRVHDRVREAGGVSELRIFEGVSQCWRMLVPLVPEATASLSEAAAFISRHMSPSEIPDGTNCHLTQPSPRASGTPFSTLCTVTPLRTSFALASVAVALPANPRWSQTWHAAVRVL